jgi:hypothetical protein
MINTYFFNSTYPIRYLRVPSVEDDDLGKVGSGKTDRAPGPEIEHATRKRKRQNWLRGELTNHHTMANYGAV